MDIDSILELLGLAEDIDIDIPDDICIPDDSIGLDIDDIDAVDPFLDSDSLSMSNDIDGLESSVDGMERAEGGHEISFGKKMCPTRHGCTGATNCNNAYGDYPG